MSYVEKYGLLVLFVLCSLIIGVGVFGDSSSASEKERENPAFEDQQRAGSQLGGRLATGEPDTLDAGPAFEQEGGPAERDNAFGRERFGGTTLDASEDRHSSGLRPVPSHRRDERLSGGPGQLSPNRGHTFPIDDDDGKTLVFPGVGGGSGAEPGRRGADAVAGFEIYTVAKNETLGQISMRKLGSIRHIPVIVAANPGLNPDRVKEGQKLRIPLAASVNRDSRKAPAAKKPANKGSSKSSPPTSKPAAKTARVHRVKRGETLSEIAQRYYKTTTRAAFLAKANGMKVNDMLPEGRKLEIPPLPATGGRQ